MAHTERRRHIGRLLLIGTVVLTQAPRCARSSACSTTAWRWCRSPLTVTDATGNYVTGLDAGNFTVLENGVAQPVAFFASGSVPIDVTLVLDTSSSMVADMPLVRTAASGLIQSLRPGDRGAVLGVTKSVSLLEAFTSDHEALERAVGAVPAKGSTAVATASTSR
ncbi:MAG: hypothetical protein R2712_17910 [Vicinamibacterales bacterium]